MRFERGCRALREGRIIEADTCTAFLTDDESKLKTLELRSNSRITTSGATEGGLQQMAARDMNISYGPDGETIEHAVLLGTGAIQLAGANGGAGRKIAGSMIDVQFAPDGSLTAISAREQVELVMPATKDTPERVIKSRTMTGTGEAGQRPDRCKVPRVCRVPRNARAGPATHCQKPIARRRHGARHRCNRESEVRWDHTLRGWRTPCRRSRRGLPGRQRRARTDGQGRAQRSSGADRPFDGHRDTYRSDLRRHQTAGRRRGAQRAQAGTEGRRPESAQGTRPGHVEGRPARAT